MNQSFILFWPATLKHSKYRIQFREYFAVLWKRSNGYRLNWHKRFWIFIIKVFRTIVFIFIVISTTFRPICPPAFFRCLSNSGTFKELRTTSFIETTGVACSDSVCHNRKRCGNNNKDEDNCPKNLNDKNQQASSQKFRQLTFLKFCAWAFL